MGTGKSTIGEKLAKKLGCKLIDTDDEIVKREGMSIPEIFSEKGETYFRQVEKEVLQDISSKDDLIVSCGGGIIKSQENIEMMKNSGEVVLLEAKANTVFNRVKDTKNRPLLEGKMSVEGIQELMDERKPLYDKAHTIRVCADGKILDICNEIESKIKL